MVYVSGREVWQCESGRLHKWSGFRTGGESDKRRRAVRAGSDRIRQDDVHSPGARTVHRGACPDETPPVPKLRVPRPPGGQPLAALCCLGHRDARRDLPKVVYPPPQSQSQSPTPTGSLPRLAWVNKLTIISPPGSPDSSAPLVCSPARPPRNKDSDHIDCLRKFLSSRIRDDIFYS